MNDVSTSVKELAKKYYPTILTDLSITEGTLEMYVEEVIDRALVYMNRDQLVVQYEKDLVSYPDQENDFWDYYDRPIPERVQRVLARTVVRTAKSISEENSAEGGAVTRVKDHGQEVTFSDKLQSFFDTGTDSDVFGSATEILDTYRLGKVPANEHIG